MKLWHLTILNEDDVITSTDLKYDWRALVVRAESEADARRIATEEAPGYSHRPEWWTDASRTACVELTPEGEPGIVIVDEVED